MSANPLRVAGGGFTAKRTQQEWIDRGNRLLWGQEADKDGVYLKPRPELEWRCKDGFYFITSRGA